jgi:hypothetical protein
VIEVSKLFLATSHVSCVRQKVFPFPLMMESKVVSETSGFYPQLTQLVAREEYIEFTLLKFL